MYVFLNIIRNIFYVILSKRFVRKIYWYINELEYSFFSLQAANILYIQVCSYCLTDTGSRATLLYENYIFLYNGKSEIYSYWALHKN